MEINGNFRKILKKVFARSFLLQALWSYKGMQNIGFLYAIKPVLDFLWRDEEKRKEAYLRHLDFFNTHPYCASYILGITARYEREFAEGIKGASAEKIVNTKKILGGPIAAFGDSMIWGVIRPFAAAVAVVVIFIFSRDINLMWLGPSVAFVVFNFVHIRMRYRGIISGYTKGEAAFGEVFSGRSQRFFNFLRTLGIVIIWFLLVKGFMRVSTNVSAKIAYPAFFLIMVFLMRKFSAVFLFYFAVVIGGIFGRFYH
ncbi:MAG: PTS system mannose/fructose/sorbose family transporter subunit IID [Elusimicrobia bacterium]|nr:PTS system mannose/fructose/sorbose family transporter subunit IID [Elusimicrobiota bacterium]